MATNGSFWWTEPTWMVVVILGLGVLCLAVGCIYAANAHHAADRIFWRTSKTKSIVMRALGVLLVLSGLYLFYVQFEGWRHGFLG